MRKRSTNELVYIYELIDPRDNKTYYIGKSTQPRVRYQQHWSERNSQAETEKINWLRSLDSYGARPKLRIVSTSNAQDWPADEGRTIREYLDNGAPLTNVQRPTGSARRKLTNFANTRTQDFWDDLTHNLPFLKFRMYPLRVRGGFMLQRLWNLNDRGWRHMEDRVPGASFLHLREDAEWESPARAADTISPEQLEVIRQIQAASPPGSFFAAPDSSADPVNPLPYPTRLSMARMDFRRDALLTAIFDSPRYEVSKDLDELDPEDLGLEGTGWRKWLSRR